MFLTLCVFLFALCAIGGFMPKYLRKEYFDQSFSQADQDRVIKLILDHLVAAHDSYFTRCVYNACCDFLMKPGPLSFEKIFAIEAQSCTSHEEFYSVAQMQALFKKRDDLNLGFDKAGQAERTFYQSEVICRGMNRILDTQSLGNSPERVALIFKMQRKITDILGPVPNYDKFDFGFGPGANVGCSKNTSVRMKLSADATSTVAAARQLRRLGSSFHAWPGLGRPLAVRGSRWTTVPKTSITDRAINIEPIVNSFLQKGIGSYIRSRLRRRGVDLNDQTVNQRLARSGSLDGFLATIDLSMASDTIAYNLVRELLPFDWFELLESCRSPLTQMPDKSWVVLEKFSSMGNGYTFELESMIFYALLLAVCDPDDIISVYGDDIICPSSKYEQVVESLGLLGFVPNSAKSYGSGPFRESCGKDYWEGVDVRPVFIKSCISRKEIFRIHNFFVRSGRLPELPTALLAFVAKGDRLFGPDGFGDGHLISNSVDFIHDKRGWCGRFARFYSWQAEPRTVSSSRDGDYGAFLYFNRTHTVDMASSTMYTERALKVKYRRKRLYVRMV